MSIYHDIKVFERCLPESDKKIPKTKKALIKLIQKWYVYGRQNQKWEIEKKLIHNIKNLIALS